MTLPTAPDAIETGGSISLKVESEGGEEAFFLIGDFGASVGLQPKTIRYYERAGLIKPRRMGRLRVYQQRDVARLETVKFLRKLGVSIRQIRKLVDQAGDFSVNELPSSAVEQFLIDHLAVMNRKHQEFELLIADLSQRLQHEDCRKPGSPSDQ